MGNPLHPEVNDAQETRVIYVLWLLAGKGKTIVSATTSLRRLLRAVETCVHYKMMTYYSGEHVNVDQQIRNLRADWKQLDFSQINASLNQGQIQVMDNGAILNTKEAE